jgi:hypothetical protein
MIDAVDQGRNACPEDHATFVSVLAFRCAWHRVSTRDTACAAALRAYLDFCPSDRDASDKVVEAVVDAIRLRPHWVGA